MVNEDTIKKRIAALDSDIKTMTNTIQEIDAKKQEAIANLNALHGAKQQLSLIHISEPTRPY